LVLPKGGCFKVTSHKGAKKTKYAKKNLLLSFFFAHFYEFSLRETVLLKQPLFYWCYFKFISRKGAKTAKYAKKKLVLFCFFLFCYRVSLREIELLIQPFFIQAILSRFYAQRRYLNKIIAACFVIVVSLCEIVLLKQPLFY
jgi:hypothetical protein